MLSLPVKLRNRIYELVLPNEVQINADCRYIRDHEPPQQPALTRVSRQIRTETLELYYSQLTVRLSLDGVNDLDDCRAYFTMIGINFSFIDRFIFENVRRPGYRNGNHYVLRWAPERQQRQLWRVEKGVSSYLNDLELAPGRQATLSALNAAIKKGELGVREVVDVVKEVLYAVGVNDDSDPDDVPEVAEDDSDDYED